VRGHLPWALALATLAACSAGESPSAPDSGASVIDPASDFIPGDPSFRRDPALDVRYVSARGETRSHNMGENCLRCHQDKGPGRGRFVVAGTVYREAGVLLTGGTVKLYGKLTRVDGGAPILEDEVTSIDVDGNGNFFTTDPIAEFPGRTLYPRFFGPGGEELFAGDGVRPALMSGGVATGGCNFCHTKALPILARTP
jgi:hypothetical protein